METGGSVRSRVVPGSRRAAMVSNRQGGLRGGQGEAASRIHGCLNGQAWRDAQASDHLTHGEVRPGKTAEAREWQGRQSPLAGVSLVIKIKIREGRGGKSER